VRQAVAQAKPVKAVITHDVTQCEKGLGASVSTTPRVEAAEIRIKCPVEGLASAG